MFGFIQILKYFIFICTFKVFSIFNFALHLYKSPVTTNIYLVLLHVKLVLTTHVVIFNYFKLI